MSPEKLLGPEKSKLAIDDFEDWLIGKCNCEKQEKDKIISEYQYVTGHAVRKLNEWIDAIRSNGKIQLLRNSGQDYIFWKSDTTNREEGKPQSPPSEAEEISKKRTIKEIMRAGYCKDMQCLPVHKDECTYCLRYLDYKRKFKLHAPAKNFSIHETSRSSESNSSSRSQKKVRFC